MKFFHLCASIVLLSSTLHSVGGMDLLREDETSKTLVVNNRILAKVNEKTISVLDVMKKMDVFLNKYYPQYADTTAARYQYFQSQWKETLSQMIDNELMIADAEKLDLKISDSEIRESIQERFGPNVMSTLDRLQLTYEEARKLVQSDLIVDRMTWYRIHSKALQSVNPQDIKGAYQGYLKKNPPKEQWEYQVLSIRTKDEVQGEQLSSKAYDLIENSKLALSDVLSEIKKDIGEQGDASITLSEEFQTDSKTISDSHKTALLDLVVNSISKPIRQVSRADQNIVYRIFHLKNRSKVMPLSFSQISDKLRDELLQNAANKESKSYLEKIRQKFGYDNKFMKEEIPSDFQPFELK